MACSTQLKDQGPRKPSDLLRHFLSDIVYGATDGIITTFAVVSGVEGAKLAPIVAVILGIVNLFADGVSMGASNFLSIRADSVVNNLSSGYKEPFYHALTTFFSFIFFGAIPLISFLIPGFPHHRFQVSLLMTTFALIFVGLLRAVVTKERWYQGMLEMLVIGGLAALIAYYLGYFLGEGKILSQSIHALFNF